MFELAVPLDGEENGSHLVALGKDDLFKLALRLPEERPSDPAEYSAAVRHEAQALRHRAHHKLMQAFLEPEIFDGAVTLRRAPAGASRQLRLVADEAFD